MAYCVCQEARPKLSERMKFEGGREGIVKFEWKKRNEAEWLETETRSNSTAESAIDSRGEW
jgi:hypothetical protein